MFSSRWGTQKALVASAAILAALITPIYAVDQSYCASVNTGASGGQSTFSIYMSAGKCKDTCTGSAVAIVQGQNCWCSDYVPAETSDASDCNSNCPGYPMENCGSSSAFGYILEGRAPLGTIGGSSASAPSTQAQPSPAPSPSPSSPPQASQVIEQITQVQTSNVIQKFTQVQTSNVVQTTNVVQTNNVLQTSNVVQTNNIYQTSNVVQTSVIRSTQVLTAPAPPPSSSPSTATTKASHPSPTSSPSTPSPMTQYITVSGRVVTVVSNAPTAPPAADQNDLPEPSSKGLSNGAVAGITIGALAGAALIGALLFLLCLRKRRSSHDSEGGIQRNTSVLSKVGLLRSDSQGFSKDPPRLQTAGLGLHDGPAYAGAFENGSQMSEHRKSRPMFVDNRLNPNALFAQSNASRTSVGTLQDNHDYSRPLEVRNPD